MRGTGVVTAVGAGLLALALLTACRSDELKPQAPASIDTSYVVDGGLSCSGTVKAAPSIALTEQPTAAIICDREDGGVLWLAPKDVLTQGLPRIMSTLAGRERAPDGDVECTFQGGTAFDLRLQLSGDRVVSVTGSTATCGFVQVSGARYYGAQAVLDDFLASVEQQREQTAPPADIAPVSLACDDVLTDLGASTSLIGDTADLVKLVSCWRPDAKQLRRYEQAGVDARDVRRLADDMTHNAFASKAQPAVRCIGGFKHNNYQQHLIGQTEWGDRLMIYGQCRLFNFTSSPGTWWHPSARAQRILDRLRD